MSLSRQLGALRLTSLARLVPGAALPPAPPAGTYLPDGDARHALDLARRAGHPERVVRDLATTLGSLGEQDRDAVRDPLRRRADLVGTSRPHVRPLRVGGVLARQTDGTTCGSAVVGMLAVAGDPVLALWLATGLRPGERQSGRELSREDDVTARFRALQHAVKQRTNRGALGLAPWPAAFGTPPWGAARVARYADVRFTHRVVEGPAPGASPVLAAALDAASHGVPVPLFTGGDLGLGVATAVPRHVVLLTTADPAAVPAPAGGRRPATGPHSRARDPLTARRCWVYEPSSGTVHRLDARDLLAGGQRDDVRRALGGWPHVCWALLPAGRAGGAHRPAGGWLDPANAG